MKLHILRKSHRGYNDKRRARERDDRSIFRFNETKATSIYIYIYIRIIETTFLPPPLSRSVIPTDLSMIEHSRWTVTFATKRRRVSR